MKEQIILPHYNLDLSGELLHSISPSNTGVEYNSPHQLTLDGRLALIDRDGVIIEKAPRLQYHQSPDTIKVISGVPEAIRHINDKNIPVVVITNQPGIYKGQHTEKDLYDMNLVIASELDKIGAHIDAVLFCPHPAPSEGDHVNIGRTCDCRKPNPRMLNQALDMFNGDKNQTFFFEDFESGLQAAKNAGVQGVYVATKHDEYEAVQDKVKERHPNVFRDFQFPTLQEAVMKLIN